MKFEYLRDDVKKKSLSSAQVAARPPHGLSDELGTEMHTVIQQQKDMLHKLEGIETLQRQ